MTSLEYWPRQAKFGIVRIDSKNRIYDLESKEERAQDIDTIDYDVRIENNWYHKGVAIRLGKIIGCMRYGIGVDLDGMEAIRLWFGGGNTDKETWDNVHEYARKYRVDWHSTDSLHLIFYADEPINGTTIVTGKGKHKEIKVICEGGLLAVPPSFASDDNQWTAMDSEIINDLNDNYRSQLIAKIDSLSNGNYMPNQDRAALEKHLENTFLHVGEHIHDNTKFMIIRYYYKPDGLSDKDKFERARNWANNNCEVPCKHFDDLCQWTVDHHKEKRDALNNKQTDGETQKKKSKVTVHHTHKYSQHMPLHESIILDRKPVFVKLIDGQPIFVDKIELDPKFLLKPKSERQSLAPSYIYDSEDDLKYYLEIAGKMANLDKIFTLVRKIISKYIVTEDHYLTLLVADIIFTYFQDKFGTTHYVSCVGDNSSGKNSILITVAYLAYRMLLATSVSAANIYTFLDSLEIGQGCIAEDEIDTLDDNPEKLNIYKSGYSVGTCKIPKTETSSSRGRSQDTWLTFCFKIFAGEKSLSESKARGLKDRAFEIKCIAGKPEYNIKNIYDSCNAHLKLELDKTRKLLFAYRILHYDDIIPDIGLNVINREAELTKPLIRLFQNSPSTLLVLLPALHKCLQTKRTNKSYSLESCIYNIIKNLTEHEDKEEYELENETIIKDVKADVDGVEVPNYQGFYSAELGDRVSNRRIIDIIIDKFKGLRDKKGRGKERKRTVKITKKSIEDKADEYPNELKIIPIPERDVNTQDAFDSVIWGRKEKTSFSIDPTIEGATTADPRGEYINKNKNNNNNNNGDDRTPNSAYTPNDSSHSPTQTETVKKHTPIPQNKRAIVPTSIASFDCEWDTKIVCMCLAESNGHVEKLHRDQFQDYKQFITRVFDVLDGYEILAGYTIFSFKKGSKWVDSDVNHLRDASELCRLEYRFNVLESKFLDAAKIFRNQNIKNSLEVEGVKYREYGLDKVSNALIGEGKTGSGKNVTDLTPVEQLDYCLQDAKLVMKMLQWKDYKLLNLLNRVGQRVNLPLLQTAKSYGPSKWYVSYLDSINYGLFNGDARKWIEANVVEKNGKKTGIAYNGGKVLTPISGRHTNVDEFDVTSMYPSTADRENIDSHTLCCSHESCKSNLIPIEVMDSINHKLKSPRPWHYYICTQNRGKIPDFMHQLMEEKADHKVNGRKMDVMVTKLLLNAMYGVLGEVHCKYYDPRVAETITGFARTKLMEIKSLLESKGVTIVYGDTDSLFCDVKNTHVDVVKLVKDKFDIDIEHKETWKTIAFTDKKKQYIGITSKGAFESTKLIGERDNKPKFYYDTVEHLKNIFQNPTSNIVRYVKSRFTTLENKINDIEFVRKELAFHEKSSMPLGDSKRKDWRHDLFIELEQQYGDDAELHADGERVYDVWKVIPPKGRLNKCSMHPEYNTISLPKYKEGLWTSVKAFVSDVSDIKKLKEEVMTC